MMSSRNDWVPILGAVKLIRVPILGAVKLIGVPILCAAWAQVADVLGKHVEPGLLRECARTLEHCALGPDAAKARPPHAPEP